MSPRESSAVALGGTYGCERVCRCAVVVLVADPYAALDADRQRLGSCGCVTPALHQVSSSSMPPGSLLSDQPRTWIRPAPTTLFLLAAAIVQQLQQPCLHTLLAFHMNIHLACCFARLLTVSMCVYVYVCVCTHRYDLPAAVGPRSSGLSFGHLPSELYSLLASGAGGYSLSSIAGFTSSKAPKHKICIVTGGGHTRSWTPMPSG